MTESPAERMAAGYTTSRPPTTTQARLAALHDPTQDAQAARLAALGDDLTPEQRMSVGYQQSAADAAHTTKEN